MVVVEQVDRDPADPPDRIVVVAQPPPAHVRPHERLLNRVGRLLGVAAGQGEGAHQPGVVGAEQGSTSAPGGERDRDRVSVTTAITAADTTRGTAVGSTSTLADQREPVADGRM